MMLDGHVRERKRGRRGDLAWRRGWRGPGATVATRGGEGGEDQGQCHRESSSPSCCLPSLVGAAPALLRERERERERDGASEGGRVELGLILRQRRGRVARVLGEDNNARRRGKGE